MKVTINDFNKPAPLLGLFSALASVGTTGANIAAQKELQKNQIAHDKDMAGINQANILAQMEQQEQYNIDAYERQLEQWNRENAYNDPSAVAARYRAAGISPQMALGGAASGAGISGGLSSTPSGASGSSTGSASKLGGTTGLEGLYGLASIINQAEVASAQADLYNAEANKLRSETPPEDQELWYQNWQKMLSSMSVDQSVVMLNTSKKMLTDAQKEESISKSAFNLAMTANTEAETALRAWQLQFNKDNRDSMLKQAEYAWRTAVQSYEFNESKNPLVLEELKGNLKIQAVNIISAQIANRLAEKNIEVSQAQINHYIAQDATLAKEQEMLVAKITTENELRNYKKAESVQRQISGYVDSVVRVGSAIATVGISEIGGKKSK